MRGERLDEVQLLETGLLGDRCWAERNESVVGVQVAKQFPRQLQCRSRCLTAPETGKIAQVEIDTLGPETGLVKNWWLGKSVRIGAFKIQCVPTTPLCGRVTREQGVLSFDKNILRTVVREADQNLGIHALTRPGRVRMRMGSKSDAPAHLSRNVMRPLLRS